MARVKQPRPSLIGLLILAASCFVGCVPRSDVFCERTYYCGDLPFVAASRAAIAVLPFQAAREVPDNFAQISGERLTGVLSQELRSVIGPADILSAWKEAANRPWQLPAGKEDFRYLGDVLNAGVAVVGTATRYVYGEMNPTEIAFKVAVVHLASGRKIASFDSRGISRKAFAYSGLSKPPQQPESLLASIMMLSVGPSVIEVLERSEKDPRGELWETQNEDHER